MGGSELDDHGGGMHGDRPWVYFMVDSFFLVTQFFVLTFKLKIADDYVLPHRLPPGGQGRPQLPQLFGSLAGSMHCWLQQSSGRGQPCGPLQTVLTQVPFRQAAPGPQSWTPPYCRSRPSGSCSACTS